MATRVIAIDPGLQGCGVALFDDTTNLLLRAQYIAGEPSVVVRTILDGSVFPYRVAIEMPRTYGGRAARGDTNDVVRLAAAVGVMTATFMLQGASVTNPLPQEWKGGSIPKPVSHKRIRARLTGFERVLLEHGLHRVSAKRGLDILDAVGIGLWHCGRMEKK